MGKTDYEAINERLQAKIDEIINQIANTDDDYDEKKYYELYRKACRMLDSKGDRCIYSDPGDSANLVEKDIYELLGYFDKDPTCEYPLSIGSSGTPYLRINSENIIMKLNKYAESDRLRNAYSNWDDNERGKLFARLMFCNDKRYSLYNFYFNGKIYYNRKSALSDKKNVYDGKTINAIPIRYADTMTPINSTIFTDKIQKYIENNSDSIKDHNINIAVFGSFSDREYPKHDIERLAEEGYFKDNEGNIYNVSITYFNASMITEEYVCFEEDENTDNKLKGNLYDINFLASVANKYNITLFLDMGCTRERKLVRTVDAGSGYLYGEIKEKINFRKKIFEFVDISWFYSFFSSIYKYIEGREISAAFDTQLVHTFYILQQKIKKNHNVLIYTREEVVCDKELRDELKKVLEEDWHVADKQNYKLFQFSKGKSLDKKVKIYNSMREYSLLYFFHGVLWEYKNPETKSCLNKKHPEAYKRIFNFIPLDKVTITLFDIGWKIGNGCIFTNDFTSIYTGELNTESEIDLEFVKYCLESKIEIDFSDIETYRTIYCENMFLEHTRKNEGSEKIIISITADTSSRYYSILIDTVKLITEKNNYLEYVAQIVCHISKEELRRIMGHKPILEIMVNGHTLDPDNPYETFEEEKEQKKLIRTP